MIVTFGKHRGESVEALVLREPRYVAWMLSTTDPTGALVQVGAEARRLIGVFNRKPFTERCSHKGCDAVAALGTVYRSNVQLVCWCDQCDPCSAGADPGKLTVIRTYWDALQHVAYFCNGRKGEYEFLIHNLAVVKGLPDRARYNDILAFFQEA